MSEEPETESAFVGDDDAGDDLVLIQQQATEPTLPVWQPTGEPRVDAAMDLLVTLDPDDVSGHAAVLDEVHERLRAALMDLDPAH